VLSAEIVLAVPYSAAPQLQNTAAVAGKVVVVQRGGSTFQEKATQAQVAGAVGVIIVNNVADDPSRLVVMNITATVGIAIKIPVVMVSQSAEAALQASQGLRITIRPTPQSPVGNSGPLRLWRSSALTAGRLVQRAVLAFAGPSPMPPTAVPIQSTCTLSNGQVVPAGWSGKSSDNCNTCSCRNGFLACTEMACIVGMCSV
jgi:fructose-specific phosphotransferase system component IIB